MDSAFIPILSLFVGIVIGTLVGYLFAKAKLTEIQAESTGTVRAQAAKLESLETEKKELQAKNEALQNEKTTLVSSANVAESTLKTERENLEKRLADRDKAMQDREELLNSAEEKLKEAFAALSSKALEEANASFLKQAESKFKDNQELAKKEWEGVIKPVSDNLERLEKLNQDLGEKVAKEYGSLDKGIKDLSARAEDLSKALSKPIVRGNWGEHVIEQMLEDAGLIKGKNFTVQESSRTDEGNQIRPDVIINLPPDRKVIVDSKTPFDAFEQGVNADTDDERREAYKRHAVLVRNHVTQLSTKKYWDKGPDTFDFVILFLPTESMYLAAIQADNELLQFARDKKVYLINPSTMMAMINLMGQLVREERMAKMATKVQEEAGELGKRIKTFFEHIMKLRNGLNNASTGFNEAFSSYESRVRPQIEKVEKLGFNFETKELLPITTTARDIPERVHAALEPTSDSPASNQLPPRNGVADD